jgi:hypothetical protein
MATMNNDWNEWATHVAQTWLDQDEYFLSQLPLVITDNYTRNSIAVKDIKSAATAAQLTDFIRDYLEECKPVLESSLYADLIDALLSEIDYTELAQLYLDDYIDDIGAQLEG